MNVRTFRAFHLTVAGQLWGQRSPSLPGTRPAFPNVQVIQLVNGPNKVDLDADGTPDLVFVSWRDKGNAHGFNVITFYHDGRAQARRDAPESELVSLFDSTGRTEQAFYRDFRGADCVLDDMRLVRSKQDVHTPVTLILGHREMGESFTDTLPITFVVYRFVRDSDVVGWPPFHSRAQRTIRSHARYCDGNAASEGELGLGPYRWDD